MLRLIQILLGIFFTASGLAKAFTLSFSAAKIGQYLTILGLAGLTKYNLLWIILIDATEVTLGIMFILNLRPKLTLWISTLMMLVFTPKTLYVAAKHLMKDSGCFGGVFPLTPWQSNWKNFFMDLLLVILWGKNAELINKIKFSDTTQNKIIAFSFILMLSFQALEVFLIK